MTHNRRNRADSLTTEGELMRATPPSPPDHIVVPDSAMPHWWAIVTAKAMASWTLADLALAGELARTFADLERLRGEIHAEGDVVKGRVNPKHALADTLTARAIRITRLLQIHPLATQGRSADQAKRNKAARAAQETAEGLGDDRLIPNDSGSRH